MKLKIKYETMNEFMMIIIEKWDSRVQNCRILLVLVFQIKLVVEAKKWSESEWWWTGGGVCVESQSEYLLSSALRTC